METSMEYLFPYLKSYLVLRFLPQSHPEQTFQSPSLTLQLWQTFAFIATLALYPRPSWPSSVWIFDRSLCCHGSFFIAVLIATATAECQTRNRPGYSPLQSTWASENAQWALLVKAVSILHSIHSVNIYCMQLIKSSSLPVLDLLEPVHSESTVNSRRDRLADSG